MDASDPKQTLVELLIVTADGQTFFENRLLPESWSDISPQHWKKLGGDLAAALAAQLGTDRKRTRTASGGELSP